MAGKYTDLTVETNSSPRHQWHTVFNAGFIDCKAGGEVVAAFKYHVALRYQFLEGVCIEDFVDGVDLNVGVNGMAGGARRM